MSEFIPPTLSIYHTENAFQEWTHFLNPRGLHTHRISPSTPRPSHTPESLPTSKHEVAWLHTEHHTVLHINSENRTEAVTSQRRQIGGVLLATMRREDESYEFTSLEELASSPDDLPIYTAAWLSRYVKTWQRDFFGILNYPFELQQLKDTRTMKLLSVEQTRELFPDPSLKPGEKDQRSETSLLSVARSERAKYLARSVIEQHPHLKRWYSARQIYGQDDATYEAMSNMLDSDV